LRAAAWVGVVRFILRLVALADFIEKLYDEFRPYRLGTAIDGCEHCLTAGMSDELIATPLRELTEEQLSLFSLKAMTTWGTEQDFKHFLPRLLELAYIDPLEMNWLEALFGKLKLAGWEDWSARERQAIESYLSHWWTATLARPRQYQFDEIAGLVLCAIGRTGIKIQPFLDQWIQDDSQAALDRLCIFVHFNYDALRKSRPRLSSAFESPESEAVVAWLQSDVKERLRRDASRIEEDLADVSWMIDCY
jgi:hypothetical protein